MAVAYVLESTGEDGIQIELYSSKKKVREKFRLFVKDIEEMSSSEDCIEIIDEKDEGFISYSTKSTGIHCQWYRKFIN